MVILALGLLAATVVCCWLHGYAAGKLAEKRRMESNKVEDGKVDAHHGTLKREQLYVSRGRGDRDGLFVRANDWLEELHGIASRELERHPENNPSYGDLYDPSDAQIGLLYGDIRPVRLGSDPTRPSATAWVRIAAERSARGYRAVEVLRAAFPAHAAIIAALTVMEGREVDKAAHRARGLGYDLDAPLYADALLRFYRPEQPPEGSEEWADLVSGAVCHISDFLSALRKLLAFLEYGEAGKDLRPAVENAGLDVTAAVLAAVEGLNSVEIGRELDIERSKTDAEKGGHSRVSKMVGRGKAILEAAWGAEGWRERSKMLKAEAAQRHWSADVSEGAKLRRRFEALHAGVAPATELARPVDWGAISLALHFREALESRKAQDPVARARREGYEALEGEQSGSELD